MAHRVSRAQNTTLAIPAGKRCSDGATGAAKAFATCLAEYAAKAAASTIDWNVCPSSTEFADLLKGNSQPRVSTQPAAFAMPGDAADAQAIIACANNASLKWTPRNGGHSYEAESLISGGVVIDLGSLTSLDINEAAKTMVVGGGHRLGPIYAALTAKGFYLPAGTCGGVGISGLTLGGGLGHSTRVSGVTSDSVISAQVGACARALHPAHPLPPPA